MKLNRLISHTIHGLLLSSFFTISASEIIDLKPEDSQIVNIGKGSLGVANKESQANFAYWTSEQSWVSWTFATQESGLYEVWSEISSTAVNSGFFLNYNDEKIKVDLKSTGSYDNYKNMKLATIELKQGRNTITLNPHRDQWQPLNIRELQLKKVSEVPTANYSPSVKSEQAPEYILKSDQAADWQWGPFKKEEFNDHWRDAYPIGSGRLGGMVYGNVNEARFMLQDARHWYNHRSPNTLPNLSGSLQRLRDLQNQGKYAEANVLYREGFKGQNYGGNIGSPLSIGDLVIKSNHQDIAKYQRTLNLKKSETHTAWSNKGVDYTRKAFISRVGESKDILFVQLNADQAKSLDISVHLGLHNPDKARGSRPKAFRPSVSVDFAGHIQYRAVNPNTTSALKDFGAVARVISHDGEMNEEINHVNIKGASQVLIAVKTFNSSDADEAIDRITRELYNLKGNYQDFLKPHLKAHQALFNAASLSLNADKSSRSESNEKLIEDARKLKLDNALVERLWAMGRYLSVVGSRKGGHPVHLTGLWNGDYNPTWAIHLMNINMPMIHWHLMDGNLSELMLPFFDMFDRQLPASRENAKKLYGLDGIYINPLLGNNEDGLVKVISPHLLHMMGNNAWVAQHYWDYYTFTMDQKFLAERAVPLMEEAATFYEGFLVENEDGFYDITPSNSPENSPLNAEGERLIQGRHIDTHKNATWEYAAIREMLTNLIEGSKTLGKNQDKISTWENMIKKLRPYEINAQGGVREWLIDGFYDHAAHRHLTHLYSIMPGYEINQEDSDPKLFKAFVKTSHNRLDAGLESQSAWSLLHNTNVLARGGDAEKAYQTLKWLAASSVLENLLTTHNDWRGSGFTMNQAPIFQIESNMGWVSAVQEMIFTSRPGVLKLLPALPNEWPKGEIQGMQGRGAVNIQKMSWSKHASTVYAELQTNHAQELTVVLPKNIKSLEINGKKQNPSGKSFSINMGSNKVYSIKIQL
jgi:alpha-L-fucosidase 2